MAASNAIGHLSSHCEESIAPVCFPQRSRLHLNPSQGPSIGEHMADSPSLEAFIALRKVVLERHILT